MTPGHPWKRWVALALLVVVLVIAFINLGEWQLRRLDERRGQNQTVVVHEGAPTLPYEQVFTREITEADQWQKVTVQGTFLPEHQLVARYRSNDGATGWEVVTPLKATDGRIVLIDRGFKQRTPGTDFPTSEAPPPSGVVSIVGYVQRNERGKPHQITPASGSVQLINSEAISAWAGVPLVNGYIATLESKPADPGFTPIALPPLDEGPHLSYALQWFTFSLIAVGGLIVFVRNDIRDRKLSAERRARREAALAASETAEAAEQVDATGGGPGGGQG